MIPEIKPPDICVMLAFARHILFKYFFLLWNNLRFIGKFKDSTKLVTLGEMGEGCTIQQNHSTLVKAKILTSVHYY